MLNRNEPSAACVPGLIASIAACDNASMSKFPLSSGAMTRPQFYLRRSGSVRGAPAVIHESKGSGIRFLCRRLTTQPCMTLQCGLQLSGLLASFVCGPFQRGPGDSSGRGKVRGKERQHRKAQEKPASMKMKKNRHEIKKTVQPVRRITPKKLSLRNGRIFRQTMQPGAKAKLIHALQPFPPVPLLSKLVWYAVCTLCLRSYTRMFQLFSHVIVSTRA
jgi:hypothetical protein